MDWKKVMKLYREVPSKYLRFYFWSLVSSLVLSLRFVINVRTASAPRDDIWWRQDRLTDSQAIIFVWFALKLFLTCTFCGGKGWALGLIHILQIVCER
jgi:hypothetical protein